MHRAEQDREDRDCANSSDSLLQTLKWISTEHQFFCERAHKKNNQHGAISRQQVETKAQMNARVPPDRDRQNSQAG